MVPSRGPRRAGRSFRSHRGGRPGRSALGRGAERRLLGSAFAAFDRPGTTLERQRRTAGPGRGGDGSPRSLPAVRVASGGKALRCTYDTRCGVSLSRPEAAERRRRTTSKVPRAGRGTGSRPDGSDGSRGGCRPCCRGRRPARGSTRALGWGPRRRLGPAGVRRRCSLRPPDGTRASAGRGPGRAGAKRRPAASWTC